MDIAKITADYERHGVVRVAGLITPAEVAEVRRQIERYTREKLATLPPGDYVLEADGKTVRNFWRLDFHDAYFRAWGERPEMLALVAPLVHGKPLFVGAETFNKPARIGSGVPYHQDNAYFCQSPPDMLTVWIAIDPVTVANGAVYYVKGSHHELLEHVPSMVKGNSIGLAKPPDVPRSEQFCGTLQPGDALIHHCQIIHHSDPNTTDASRCGFLLVFRGTHTKQDPALRERYTKALAMVSPESTAL